MSLIGKKVYHDKFGEGVIVEQSNFYISVNFNNTCKRFVYPACINSFLHLVDTTIDTTETSSLNSGQITASPSPLDSSLVLNKKESSDGTSMPIHHFSSAAQFYMEYNCAITAEVVHLKKNGGKRQRLFDGKRIGFFNGRYVYTFESDVALNYPEGTQINIWRQGICIPCRVMSCEDFSIIISIGADLGPSISSIEFSAEPWQLLNALINQLSNTCDHPSEIVHELICSGHKQIDRDNQRITTGQKTAIKMSFNQPITFIWGPPGTGKTQTLASIALAHIKQGNRVLMLSYSNVSVDGAIMRIHALSPHMDPGILLRYGYARQADLLNHDYLTSYNFTIRKHPDLLKEQLNLVAERKKLPQTSPRYMEIVDRLSDIKKYLSTEEKEYTKNASFVATTVSKAIVDATIYSTDFDTVIFDEASMAYVPQIVFSAGLAKKHFICMGDFCQLPPIVQSKNAVLLSKDIFQYSGITSAIDSGCNHKWLCLLDTQYRMHPTISDFASQEMYNGLLRSSPDMLENRRSIVEHEPIANHAISFVDLSGTMSVCSKTSDNSRINVLSSFASFSLAISAAKSHEVGIITPYHSQSRLLYAMSQDIADAFPSLNPISCATVHQFQGSEKDVIIYDAVDCYRMSYPGMLLTSMDNNYANRLFNVALTRSRGKFIGLANVEYMSNKKLSNKLMFSQLISAVQGGSNCLSLKDIAKMQTASNNSPLHFYKKAEANEILIADISSARREIHVDIPDSPVDDVF